MKDIYSKLADFGKEFWTTVADGIEKIEGMQVSGRDSDVELTIDGDLDATEIEAAVAKSPLIND